MAIANLRPESPDDSGAASPGAHAAQTATGAHDQPALEACGCERPRQCPGGRRTDQSVPETGDDGAIASEQRPPKLPGLETY
jgi:hypothetical protein